MIFLSAPDPGSGRTHTRRGPGEEAPVLDALWLRYSLIPLFLQRGEGNLPEPALISGRRGT
jgi:hypothetical protein